MYNISVLDHESYTANGIIVHNCRSALKPLADSDLDNNMIFENRDFSKAIDNPDEVFKKIDGFNDKYRVSKFTLDQDIAARIMMEKGVFVGIEGPALEGLLAEPTDVLSFIESKEEEIRSLPYEKCYAFDKSGKITLTKSGTDSEIQFSADEVEKLLGTTFTHNHPRSVSFSPADIKTACVAGMVEMRVVCSDYTYTINLSENVAFDYKMWEDEIEPLIQKYESTVGRKMLSRIASGELTYQEAISEHWHEIWMLIANDIPRIRYIRK